jgi:pimeloyl-ACP methyl ester carboxylesterase
MAADYARVLKAISPNADPVSVMGLSTGGLIAQHLAAQAPELLDRLVLVVTAARLSPEGRDLVLEWRSLAARQQWTALTTAMIDVLVTSVRSKRFIHGVMGLLGWLIVKPPQHPEDFIVTMDAVLAHDTTTLLPTLRMPTLVLSGDLDPFFPASLLHETAALLPNAVLKVYQGAGHGLTKLHKRRFERDVLAFLADRFAPIADHSEEKPKTIQSQGLIHLVGESASEGSGKQGGQAWNG